MYETHTQAEDAVKELEKSGFDMKHLSIIGRDYYSEEHVVGYYNAGDRMKYWGKLGAFWGGLWGLLFGSAFFWIPGIGPLLVAGPLASIIIGGLEGAAVVGGLSALSAGLYSIGVPKVWPARSNASARWKWVRSCKRPMRPRPNWSASWLARAPIAPGSRLAPTRSCEPN